MLVDIYSLEYSEVIEEVYGFSNRCISKSFVYILGILYILQFPIFFCSKALPLLDFARISIKS